MTQKVRCKKVNSRMKAGRQTRTIIFAVPEEKGEITDVGAAKRKRERPRKTPEAELPDPRKRVFWILRRESARTLWEGTPFWG